MAKNVLRAWLVDNTVTTDDKTDKIFQLETTRSIDKNIILDRMVAKNPGVRRETMALGIELMEEVIAEALMNGESEHWAVSWCGTVSRRSEAERLECSNQQHLCLVHSGQDASRRLVQHNHGVVYLCHSSCDSGSQHNAHRRVSTCHREVLAEKGEIATCRGAEVRCASSGIPSAADVEFCGTFSQHVHTCILNSLRDSLSCCLHRWKTASICLQ